MTFPFDRRDFLKLGASAPLVLATRSQALAQESKVVRTISIPTDAAKQLLYAQQAGLFKKHGLQVEIEAMGSGSAIIAAVVGGSAEFGSGAVFSVFTAYGRGVPLRIVAPIAIYDSAHCDAWMLVAKDSKIENPRDLNGKIIGSDTPNDMNVSAVRAWIDQHGGEGKSLKAIELKPSAQAVALAQGRIDACVLRPPYLTTALQSGMLRVLGKPLDVISPRFLLSCWIATQDYIDKNPETVKAFVAALMESARYVNKHGRETVDMVAKFSGQDPSLLAQGVRSVIAETVSLSDIQRPLDFAYKHGVIDKQYDAKAVLAPSMPMASGPRG